MMPNMFVARMIKIKTIRLTKKTGHISREMYLKRVSLNVDYLSFQNSDIFMEMKGYDCAGRLKADYPSAPCLQPEIVKNRDNDYLKRYVTRPWEVS